MCSVAKLCLTLCDPMDWSLPDSSVHGISQARILEWVDIPPPGDLPNPGIEPKSPALAGRFFTTEPPGKPSKKADIYKPRRCLPRTQPHWHLDPGHPSLQNCEREMSNVCCLSPRSFVGSLKWWRWSLAAPTLCDSETLNSLSIRNKGAPPLHL